MNRVPFPLLKANRKQFPRTPTLQTCKSFFSHFIYLRQSCFNLVHVCVYTPKRYSE